MQPSVTNLRLPKDDTDESVPGSDLHQQAVVAAYSALKMYAEGPEGPSPAWYVSSQITVTVGLPPSGRSVWRHRPDVFVVPGAPVHPRSVYDVRTEGVMPPFIFEVAGANTRYNDVEVKPPWYGILGVWEYLVFDPTLEQDGTSIKAWHTTPEGWTAWPPRQRADGTLAWDSRVLGLAIRAEGPVVRFDAPDGQTLPTQLDLWQRLRELEGRRGS